MMKRGLTFAVLMTSLTLLSTEAKADIEALQAVITAVGDVVQGAQEQITKAKAVIEKAQELATQAKKFANDVKSTVDQAKDTIEQVKTTVKTAEEKAQAIKDRVNNAVNAVKTGDLNGLKSQLSSVEFSGLNNVFDGSRPDDEAAEAVLDNMVRKKGADSITNQKILSDALNRKNGIDMANMFGKTIVLRQVLRNEADDFQNPQSVDEAIQLSQNAQLSSIKRRKDMLNMEATIARLHHAQALQNVEGSYGEKDE